MNTTSRTHPLRDRELTGISEWSEWLLLWEKAETAEELISLLHYSADIDMSREPDPFARTKFWLAVADGYALDMQGVRGDGLNEALEKARTRLLGADEPVRRYETRIRAATALSESYWGGIFLKVAVARKAWLLLCTRVFDSNDHYWSRKPDLFTAVLDFFDPIERWYNIPSWRTAPEHQSSEERTHVIARHYLGRFVRAAWRASKDGAMNVDKAFRAREKLLHEEMVRARPKLIGILAINGNYEELVKLLLTASPRLLKYVEALALAGHEEGQILATKPVFASLSEGVAKENALATTVFLHGMRRGHSEAA